MTHQRREFLQRAFLTAAATATYSSCAKAVPGKLGIPGPFRGRVVAVEHPGSISPAGYQREPVRQMMHKGVMELTGAPSPQEAWRYFFQPGDVVGIKVNPVGQPHVISSAEVFQEIVEGLKMAGVKTRDIVAYDRYKKMFVTGGFEKWLPEGVRWTWATENFHELQLDMDGYDENHYMETQVVLPKQNPSDPHHRRSYVAKFLTKDVNKMVSLGVLKHHQSAGITLALKNMSHGLVNNVSRSHSTPTLNTCGTFIPAVVDIPIIRERVVLHILDGVLGAYHGGPGGNVKNYMWNHQTMYFATDPVAMDRIGWKVIDAKRTEMGMKPVGEAPPDKDSTFYRMQPEHVEIAGVLGLGEYDDKKIDLRKFKLA